jgi:replicative DNA helicase
VIEEAPPPYSEAAEQSVIGQMLANPACIGEVTSTLLEGDHFFLGANRVLYEAIVENFYADDPTDPLTIAETCGPRLARLWSLDEKQAVTKVRSFASGLALTADPIDHARLVKSHADLRGLLDLAATIEREVAAEQRSPEQIAGIVSSEAMRIATNALTAHEVVSFADAGRHFIQAMRERVALKQAGVEPGVKFGISAIDGFTRGLLPTELLIGGGEAGVGKSGVWWIAAMKYAEKQYLRPPDERIGTLILSLEMGELPSSTRFAQAMTHIESAHMREGTLSTDELRKIVAEWKKRKEWPLWLNYASGMRLSQLRAVVAEAIRKHAVGLIVIDHFLLLETDRRMDSNEADDERVRFLKNQIAKDLNVAVVCLAHTRKGIERADKRPRMSDLRGSGMIAAFADYVMLMFRPWQYATEKERNELKVHSTDAEMWSAKNRHGIDGMGQFYFDAAKQVAL